VANFATGGQEGGRPMAHEILKLKSVHETRDILLNLFILSISDMLIRSQLGVFRAENNERIKSLKWRKRHE
jgi:hypothetical protein